MSGWTRPGPRDRLARQAGMRANGPARDDLASIADLIEERAKIRTFGQDWERATECDD